MKAYNLEIETISDHDLFDLMPVLSKISDEIDKKCPIDVT